MNFNELLEKLQIKKVIRSGKKVKKLTSDREGYKIVGKKEVKMSKMEQKKRKKGAKVAKRKRKSQMNNIIKRREKSMRLRNGMPSKPAPSGHTAAFKESYFAEAKITGPMYHGRSVKSDKFDYSYVGLKNATDQEGPGFYFSTDKHEAQIYSSGGTIITAQPNFRKTISSKKKSANKSDIVKMVKMAPDLDDTLTNWGYGDGRTSKQEALNDLTNSMLQYSENELDAFLSVWIDAYRYNPQSFAKNMTKIGYDAAIKDKHIIVYNPKSFTITDMEQ